MSSEERAPYFSTRVRVADITSPKDLAGLKEFTCELVYGNQETKVIARSKEDLADIKTAKIFDEMDRVFDERNEWAKRRGFTFIDQVDVAQQLEKSKK